MKQLLLLVLPLVVALSTEPVVVDQAVATRLRLLSQLLVPVEGLTAIPLVAVVLLVRLVQLLRLARLVLLLPLLVVAPAAVAVDLRSKLLPLVRLVELVV